MNNIKDYLRLKRSRVNKYLNKYLPKAGEPPRVLHKAMRYSVFAGGKRLRPILALLSGELLGQKESVIMPAACALELIHTYSLIHDDLPAMDNDNFRRGKPTSHRVFGEARAILAGDALLTLAFQLITENIKDPRLAVRLVQKVSSAAGSKGMVGGQVFDIASPEVRNPARALRLSPEATLKFAPDPSSGGRRIRLWRRLLKEIHQRKTAAMITAAVLTGALIGRAKQRQLQALARYGKNLGLAFQIMDDVLDVKGSLQKLGKTPGKDTKHGKLTAPALFGIERARRQAEQLIQRAKKSLSLFGPRALNRSGSGRAKIRLRRIRPWRRMNALADYIINRSE